MSEPPAAERVDLGPAATLLVASALTVMAGAVIAPALPRLRQAFLQTPRVDLLARLVLTVPAAAIALSAPIAGTHVDRWGRRPVLLSGLLTYAIGGSSGLYLPDLLTILGGRVVLGLGVAATMTATTTLITDRYAGRLRERFLAWQASFMGAGGILFLIGGGVLADVHWRAPFCVYAIALLVLVAAAKQLPEPCRARVDAHDTERAGALRSRVGTIIALYALTLSAMLLMFFLPVQLPFMLAERLSSTGLTTGLAIGSATFWSAAASLATPRVRRRIGRRATLALTFAPVVPSYLLLAGADGWAVVYFALALAGLGLGLLMPNITIWLAELAPPAQRGRVLGGLATAVFVGQFLSPLLAQPLLARGDFRALFVAGASAAALLALLAPLAGRRASEGVETPAPPRRDER